jgi:hypothetical protein
MELLAKLIITVSIVLTPMPMLIELLCSIHDWRTLESIVIAFGTWK